MRKVVVVGDDGEEHEHNVPQGARLAVRDGDRVRAGDRLTEGSLDPHELLRCVALGGAAASSEKCRTFTAARAWRSTTSTSKWSCAR